MTTTTTTTKATCTGRTTIPPRVADTYSPDPDRDGSSRITDTTITTVACRRRT
jgi:hypothetical protein